MIEQKPGVVRIFTILFLLIGLGLTIENTVNDDWLAFTLIMTLMCLGLFSVKRTLGNDFVSSVSDAVKYTMVYSVLLYTLRHIF